ncbi:guanylate kinase [Segnochrobactrum spirostomi]|uniref:Guanylate kinase n=1 Tax=Segnochrobactrum spirostomi TaxID=2608987 RepID=A0A6A7XY28_9HYPH|nr:guanylate kinase [Segnochrobactrum spirostomi]MQT11248.1 guanylate kinase [Segnochrobactrum spirostomi]
MVLSSPSGAGKSTLTRNLLQDPAEQGRIRLSVSVTTRARRPSEIDGTHYHFIPVHKFEAMRDHGELIEWAEVHGNFYGTPKEPVENWLQQGLDVVFDIDWQGTQQLAKAMPDDVVTLFVLPPAARELKARLDRRAEDSEETIARRLVNAKSELDHWVEYDYVVVNDDLERAIGGVKAILRAERLKRTRAEVGIARLIESIKAEL